MADGKQELNSALTYADAGVDITAGNALVEAIKPLARATARLGSNALLGGFGGLFDLAACGYRDPVLVAANDGVGTKLRLAIDSGRHDTIGIDLVAMSVNDLVVQGAEPLFFLDYFATGHLDINTARTIVSGIAQGCLQAGCALIGGETAEMPGLYHGKDYDLAGFAVGAVERNAVLPRADVAPGDVLLGLASTGFHSNGYSLVRKLVERSGLALDAPAPFASGQSMAQALLTPTRIYVKSVLAALRTNHGIKALAHITGGGLVENIPRVLPDAVAVHLDLARLPDMPVFRWARETGNISTAEMLRTFNCGVGMVVVCAADQADTIAATLAAQGETVMRLGTLEPRDGSAVITHNRAPFDAD